MHPTLTKSYEAAAATGPNLIVAAHADRRKIAPASAAGQPLIGVSDLGAPQGGMCDVHLGGSMMVKAGGALAAGDPVTANAQAQAVKAQATAGVAVRVVGYALEPAVAGDLFEMAWAPSTIPAI